MQTNTNTPTQALSSLFLKQNAENIDIFKKYFDILLSSINEKESEEFHKNLIINFLNAVYYQNTHFINTKGRADLVIHNGTTPESSVGVLIEAKSPTNKTEMVSCENLNAKSFQELVLYYLRERKAEKNFELRYLIITNVYEWFVFDAQDFEKLFYQNKKLLKDFEQFKAKTLSGITTDFFYKDVAAPEIEKLKNQIPFVHFDIRDYKEKSTDNEDFIALAKFFSPVHLLKREIQNDNNKLNKEFYNELLHILGLTETKSEGKIKIERKTEKERDSGSLLELTIAQLETMDLGNEDTFETALSLVITWTNRILFMKLLEAQLLKYHEGNVDYAFLLPEKISAFGKMNTLFFQVLAQTADKRQAHLQEFDKIPYLNSSLFEQTEEENRLKISELSNDICLEQYGKSVLNEKTTDVLNYLLKFLNAYNFSGQNEKNEDPNKLISAAVLGLIFEKINGYKDGSFFTPSFITMYMCRETISAAVVQKFNEAKGWNCKTIDDLSNHIGKNTDEIKEANAIFNTIKICDPAVGSGHFLVSALNELIFLKAELGILADENGKKLNDYKINVENDELVIIDENGKHFAYNPQNSKSQRIQETIFKEKQKLIENCLFGVDINPNSVKICQLRLWVELLKNSYYCLEPRFSQDLQDCQDVTQKNLDNSVNLDKIKVQTTPTLQTLPNIDINIKCGNSLLHRFDLRDKFTGTAGMEQKVKQQTERYKKLVWEYKNCNIKERKKQITNDIDIIQKYFFNLKDAKDKDYMAFRKAEGELFAQSINFADEDFTDKNAELTAKKLELEKIYEDKKKSCFEWRFEFPEVLDDDGNFAGFDLVIGNPPYMILTKNNSNELSSYNQIYKSFEKSNSKNIFVLFIEIGIQLLSKNSRLCYIVPEGLLKTRSYESCVNIMQKSGFIDFYSTFSTFVFENAVTGSLIFSFNNYKNTETKHFHFDKNLQISEIKETINPIFEKITQNSISLKSIATMFKGMVVKDRNKVISNDFVSQKNVFLFGKNISKWFINSKCFTDYENLEIIGGTKKLEKHQQVPRILIRRTGDTLCCAFLEEPALTESTLYSCWSVSEKVDNKYLFALLNSKLLNYYNKENNITNQQAFPQILMTDLENLPIKITENQQPIINLVTEILENPTRKNELEKGIDKLVYELYDLTEEEIKIIEK